MLLFVSSIFVVIGLAYTGLMIRPDAQLNADATTVRVYCASGVSKPVEEVIAAYNEMFDVKIEIVRTGGSGDLAGQIKTEFETGLVGGADIFITADDLLLDQAYSAGIVSERFPLARQQPVVAVTAASEIAITSVRDLVQMKNFKFGIAADNSAVGRIIRKIAKRDGFLTELESQKAADAENVMTLAQAIVVGSLDAAVIWDTTVSQINQTNRNNDAPLLKIAVFADPTNEFSSNIAIGIVTSSRTPTECLKFARYLTSAKKSRAVFERYGYSIIDGD